MYEGLSNIEAIDRLKRYGYNELPSSKPKSLTKIVLEVIKEPMFLLLLSAGAVYIGLGDYSEGIVLLSWVLIIIYITYFQHRKTERSLDVLKQLSAPRALVIRDGMEQRIAGREVVPGDLLILHEGDRIPADATLVENNNVLIDESLLTGESVPVRKDINSAENRIFSGSLVVNGSCLALVDVTGKHTAFGKIGISLSSIKRGATRLQSEMKVLIRNLFIAGILISTLVVGAFYLSRGDFLQSLLNGLAASMALLPEEFPVVLTIFLALGAWRLSKKNVLTRDPSAIETLGSATVLCSDKTGTITQNKMSIALLWDGKDEFNSEELEKSPLCKEHLRTLYFASNERSIDPMEKAIADKYQAINTPINMELIKEYTLSTGLFAMTRVLRLDQSTVMAFCKGAPEAVLSICGMSKTDIDRELLKLEEFAGKGYRVLAFASGAVDEDELPNAQTGLTLSYNGMVCFEDPIRAEVPNSVLECNKAGIQVIMITGDYPLTARSIAHQIGLPNHDKVISGPDLDALSEEELQKEIIDTRVFARIVPEQKMRIVQALRANGHIVAMTGDGINDAPALKSADIGIAMGMKGTDVAREASSLVLLDDNFTSIVEAIRSGRRIYDNLEKAMSYIIAIHIPIIGLVLLPGFIPSLPILLMPLHIVFMELIIDPACSIAFESEQEEMGIMTRPPRPVNKKFFGWASMIKSMSKGFLLLAAVLAVFLITLHEGHSPDEVRAISFSTLIIGNLIMIIHSLSQTRDFISVLRENNKALVFITLIAICILTLILSIPFLQDLFSMQFPGYYHFSVALAAGLLLLLFLEGFKKFNYIRGRNELENHKQ